MNGLTDWLGAIRRERESSDDSLSVPVSGVHEQTDRRPDGVRWLAGQPSLLSLSLSLGKSKCTSIAPRRSAG